jgi:hypothetical protein
MLHQPPDWRVELWQDPKWMGQAILVRWPDLCWRPLAPPGLAKSLLPGQRQTRRLPRVPPEPDSRRAGQAGHGLGPP